MKGLLRLAVLVGIGVWLWAGGLSMLTAAAAAVAGMVMGFGWLLLAAAAVGVVGFVAWRWFKSRQKGNEGGGPAPLAGQPMWVGNSSASNVVNVHVSGGK